MGKETDEIEPTIAATIICRTEGCPLSGVEITLEYVGTLVCGGCDTAPEHLSQEVVT